MKITDLKRGMRVTFRNGDVRVIDSFIYDFDGYYKIMSFKNIVTTGFTLKMNNTYSYYDIIEVEDLSEKGNYYTIWKIEETKYYIKPKGMKTLGDRVLCYVNSSCEWILFGGLTETTKSKFTKQELKELGIDIEHFDLEEVKGEE